MTGRRACCWPHRRASALRPEDCVTVVLYIFWLLVAGSASVGTAVQPQVARCHRGCLSAGHRNPPTSHGSIIIIMDSRSFCLVPHLLASSCCLLCITVHPRFPFPVLIPLPVPPFPLHCAAFPASAIPVCLVVNTDRCLLNHVCIVLA